MKQLLSAFAIIIISVACCLTWQSWRDMRIERDRAVMDRLIAVGENEVLREILLRR